jgi:hypothetical protein
MRNLEFRHEKNLCFVARKIFPDFYVPNFCFGVLRHCQKCHEIRRLPTFKRFFTADGTGKCPQSRIERCPDSRGSFSAKIARWDRQMSRIGRCLHREVLLYALLHIRIRHGLFFHDSTRVAWNVFY